ncbi:MAG: carbon-nitrogen hydrolase family protein [Candidatus Methanomethyliales bacterium]|nr:carbon-nitrogen hydrolase family protein [Candidatus Methanomethylicales archaeon]
MSKEHTGDIYPKLRVAAVQAAPVFLDREETVSKLEGLVAKAKKMGADLVVFGESFIPAFPIWNNVYPPIDQHEFYRRLFDNAVTIPGSVFTRISDIARENEIFLSVGLTEKAEISLGTMWNTNLLFDKNGVLLNKHRKLVPTWAEKLTWACGDGSSLRVASTEIGRIGALICGENTNPLARFTLLAQGEQIHIATYPPIWPFKRQGYTGGYKLADAIRIRAVAHSFEGKVFTIVSSCFLDEYTIEEVSKGNPEIRNLLENSSRPITMICGPTGDVIAEQPIDKEGILIADIDLSSIIEQKEIHDIIGYYNRFDIFHLEVDFTPNVPLWYKTENGSGKLSKTCDFEKVNLEERKAKEKEPRARKEVN